MRESSRLNTQLKLSWRSTGDLVPNPSVNRTCAKKPRWPVTSNYKGFPTFVKQKHLMVNREAIDHES
jgi:hypothetical protein